eukprot:4807500-Amphidinium_carterae.1
MRMPLGGNGNVRNDCAINSKDDCSFMCNVNSYLLADFTVFDALMSSTQILYNVTATNLDSRVLGEDTGTHRMR